MIQSYKVMLLPNNKQRTKLFQSAGTARFAYNWALDYEQQNYHNGGKFISDKELRKVFTQLKKVDKYRWLNSYSNNITKQAIKDAVGAYKNFFSGVAKFPRFKTKRRSSPSFYVDTAKIKFTASHVKLEKIADNNQRNRGQLNFIRLAEHGRIPLGVKYLNPRVMFDGLNWWISVAIEFKPSIKTPKNDGLGIDIGVNKLAVCSNGVVYENINKAKHVRKLTKKRRRIQRRLSKKYLKNKKGDSYCKTQNIIKSEKQLLKVNRTLTNIRHNHLHKVTSDIVGREPRFVVLEDLNVRGMMKNKHLSKVIQEQEFREFYRQMEYKCRWNSIELVTADRFYSSSKMCCKCGNIKTDLKLSDRTYVCNKCGNAIDRDYQASVNLKRYKEFIA